MKLVYDHQIFSMQIYGGISRYFYELLIRYKMDDEIQGKLSLKYSDNYYISDRSVSNHKNLLNGYKFKRRSAVIDILNKISSKRNLRKGDFDIFHPTYYDTYFLESIGDRPFVLTVYDMIHELYPDIFSKEDTTSARKRLLAEKATKIIAISENTKRDIVRLLGIDEKKIEVIYLGNSLDLSENEEDKVPNLPERYVLFVGTRYAYKNFNNFIKAMSMLMAEDKSLKVVCSGGGSFSQEEMKLLESLGIEDRVLQFSVNDKTLAQFYKNALAFVFPSLYEGFGIPILEAFACGCPAIISDSSSFPEVAGDGAAYFDPLSEISIKEAIGSVIYDKARTEELRAKGYDRNKEFSWDKTAKQTKDFYRSIL